MQDVADQLAPTTIRADLCAIFISLELSRSIWLATSLSPGRGEKMSKRSVSAGDIAALLARISELRRKAYARTGKSFPIIVIQEAGLDGFWIHRVLLSEGIESHVVDAASIATSRRRRRAKTDRIDGEALLRALLAHKRGEPRVCSMVRAPTPEDEDRRRICRERKVLIMERVQHVNRIKGLLFSQGSFGYEPLRRDRRARLDALQTGDGRRLPEHLKAQVCRELDRLELLLEQIEGLWRPSGTRCSTHNIPTGFSRRRCCWVSMGLGRNSLRSSGLRGSPDTSITADRSPLMPALPRRLGKAGWSKSRAGHLAIGQPATSRNDNSARLALDTLSPTSNTARRNGFTPPSIARAGGPRTSSSCTRRSSLPIERPVVPRSQIRSASRCIRRLTGLCSPFATPSRNRAI